MSDDLARLADVRALLADGFSEDPLFRWIFPDDGQRPAATAAWLGLFAEGYLRGGRVDVLDDDDDAGPVAVAVWRLPGDRPVISTAPSPPDLLAAIVGSDRARDVFDALAELATHWPEEPFAYLQFLAVRSTHRGRGLGRRVLAPGLAAAGAAGLSVQLETMNPASRDFYRSIGFTIGAEIQLRSGGPLTWVVTAHQGQLSH